mmetsp:Transcript_25985/g.75096  ORF Transcript_25985/g.75096 Transcript_25985/m.75096 type:complete len:88 (-) Transcript_25985:1100-1363(-)
MIARANDTTVITITRMFEYMWILNHRPPYFDSNLRSHEEAMAVGANTAQAKRPKIACAVHMRRLLSAVYLFKDVKASFALSSVPPLQ